MDVPSIHTGIGYEDAFTSIGMVSQYEEREAAIFQGCPWHVWTTLPTFERAGGVAHFRLHHLINLHQNDAAERSRRKAGRNASRV